jgi:hypothetical protein
VPHSTRWNGFSWCESFGGTKEEKKRSEMAILRGNQADHTMYLEITHRRAASQLARLGSLKNQMPTAALQLEAAPPAKLTEPLYTLILLGILTGGPNYIRILIGRRTVLSQNGTLSTPQRSLGLHVRRSPAGWVHRFNPAGNKAYLSY